MRNSILGICIGLGIMVTPMNLANSLPATVQQQISQGREAMLRGDYLGAIALWQEAKQSLIARRQTEGTNVAIEVLIDHFLSIGYQEIGDLSQAETVIASARKLLEQQQLNSDLAAKVLNTQANLNLKQDDFPAAALNFGEAQKLYQQNQDVEGEIGATVNQAIAFQKLGQYRTAQKILEKIEVQLASMPQSLQATGYKALGTTYATMGNVPQAQEKLEASIALTQNKDAEITAKTKIDLAAVIKFADSQDATKLLQEVASTSKNRETQAIALLNQIDIELEAKNWQTAVEIARNSQDLILNLPHNDFAKINLIHTMAKLDSYQASELKSAQISQTSDTLVRDRHKQLLEQIAQSAKSRGIVKTESYGIGTLAYIEEQQGNLAEAIKLNEYALSLTNAIAAEDIAYQWQWQLGRIFKTQGKTKEAIAAYQRAVNDLDRIRKDLVAFNPESQYSFRESVEPVYRQLVELLISQPSQENLLTARNTIESLQMAELENYFRQSCLQAKPEQIDHIDPKAATIYPIVTANQLAVLTSIPGQPIQLHTQPITADNIDHKIQELMGDFNPAASNKRRKATSQEFYNWLVEPTLDKLKTAKTETLVFVLEGSMRNLPVAALYDGKQYLVENYAIALTPGLQLLPSQTLNTEKIEAVVGGLSEANQGFVALPGVATEVKEIADQVNSQVLLNQEFTKDRLRQIVKASTNAPIVHLATHGQFSSKPEETFILTWHDRINVNELEQLLKVREETSKLIPIELLVLSACQTAQGDDRAALGLAGVALKSGARSTLGTLWSVSDESTSMLINEVYRQIAINPHNKAEILREAQLKLIKSEKFNHPYYWAAFVLVGNWL
jgi:CHAT domain-containing protein